MKETKSIQEQVGDLWDVPGWSCTWEHPGYYSISQGHVEFSGRDFLRRESGGENCIGIDMHVDDGTNVASWMIAYSGKITAKKIVDAFKGCIKLFQEGKIEGCPLEPPVPGYLEIIDGKVQCPLYKNFWKEREPCHHCIYFEKEFADDTVVCNHHLGYRISVKPNDVSHIRDLIEKTRETPMSLAKQKIVDEIEQVLNTCVEVP